MSPVRSQERTVVVVLGALLAVVVVSLLLAPMVLVQGCGSSSDSSCQDYSPQTLLGYEANVWVWGAVLLTIIATTFWLIRRAKPRP